MSWERRAHTQEEKDFSLVPLTYHDPQPGPRLLARPGFSARLWENSGNALWAVAVNPSRFRTQKGGGDSDTDPPAKRNQAREQPWAQSSGTGSF